MVWPPARCRKEHALGATAILEGKSCKASRDGNAGSPVTDSEYLACFQLCAKISVRSSSEEDCGSRIALGSTWFGFIFEVSISPWPLKERL
jgi:hypothetical protein